MQFPLRPVPKPNFGRSKPTAKERGKITKDVYAKASARAGGRCECCKEPFGWDRPAECAHLVRRWKLPETTDKDVAMLCGPAVNTGTCHNAIDYTAAGRKWAEDFRLELYLREGNENG